MAGKEKGDEIVQHRFKQLPRASGIPISRIWIGTVLGKGRRIGDALFKLRTARIQILAKKLRILGRCLERDLGIVSFEPTSWPEGRADTPMHTSHRLAKRVMPPASQRTLRYPGTTRPCPASLEISLDDAALGHACVHESVPSHSTAVASSRLAGVGG